MRKKRNQRMMEAMEPRLMFSAAANHHVLILSVDGLHGADVTDPALQADLTNVNAIRKTGVTYTKASTTSPSDSFPGTLSYLTGAGPGTTGVFYDDSYSRTLLPPGSSVGAKPGTEVQYFESVDKNPALISGGGNFDASSLDLSKLPVDPTTGKPVLPSQFLKTNTIFDIASKAGLYTAFSDKHPAYQIANGNNPTSINDFYGPEINSTTALLDNTTGKTVDANALLNASAPQVAGLTVAPGYTVRSFATSPAGTSQPDSLTVDGTDVFVGYNNGAAKDGTDGKSSTIVQYTIDGKVVKTFSVPGHNDGLKVDPQTHLVWALQNEDGNSNLVVINPTAGTSTQYAMPAVNGGGYDDITFLGGKVYMTASAPAKDPNTDPAVVQVTLSGGTATFTPVLLGNATATNLVTKQQVTLNLQDPDSMSTDLSGNLVLTSQADNELVTIHNPGTAAQFVTVLPLSDAANLLPGHGVDDTLFTPSASGEILVTDQKTGAIYIVSGSAVKSGLVLSAAQDAGQLGSVNTSSGLFMPVISGLGSPRGLAFVNAGAFTDLSNYTLVDASTDPAGPNDPNLINDTTHNVLLTEKYDDLKVQAILNEIAGKASHASSSITSPQVPNLFGMNFQAVSVAEKYTYGGIQALGNGQEGSASQVLQAAIQHTDASIGKIVAALKSANLWNTTELFVTAKHGQAPRVGSAGLMADSTLPDLLSNAGTPVAFTVQDDVSLLYLQDQSKTAAAVTTLQNFKSTGTIDVFFKGVKQTLPAVQIIDKILAGHDLVKSGLGNPAKNDTTPDIIVTLKPGYVWVGNPLKFTFKNGEHGGFSADDTHVALIVGGGAVSSDAAGTTINQAVQTKQIAVSALQELGLNPEALQGAEKEGTRALPGLGKGETAGQGDGSGSSETFGPSSQDQGGDFKKRKDLFNSDVQILG